MGNKTLFLTILLLLSFLFPSSVHAATTPVQANGQLHVCGLKLCNQYNQVIQLRSMANLGGSAYNSQCTTPETINYAASLGADIVRMVVFPGDEANKTLINSLIQAATTQGIYVVVDWHGIGNPASTQATANAFFDWVSRTYNNQNNILYEPFNEPDNTVLWPAIRAYHQVIVNTIRANDPDNIILLGNEGWDKQALKSGGAQRIKDDPVQGSNLMYTVHTYAEELGTYSGLNTLTSLKNAANIIPLFFTEWAYYSYLGGINNNPNYQPELGQAWIDEMRRLNISWISWWFIDGSDPVWFLTPGSCVTKNYSLRSPAGPQTLYWQNNPADSWSSAPTPTPSPTASATKAGDANGDTKVDGVDYVIWLNHYNQTITGGSSIGDFNGSGKVDGVDYVIWINNYGT